MDNNRKGILKYTSNNDHLVALENKRQSWLSRLQTKIYTQIASQLGEEQDDPSLIEKQNLKRVTFSLDNLFEEHTFSLDDTPSTYQHIQKVTPQVSDLYSYYEHACIERQEACIDHLRSILRSNCMSQLRSINLSKHSISANQANPISDMLKLNFGLTNLNLSNCNLSDEALRIILCSLLVGNTIQQLNLSNNQFTCKGYKYIALFIKSSKSLQSIDLSECTIEKKGMEYLSQGLKYATSLSKLIVNNCTFNPPIDTLDVFSEGIYKSNSLKSLVFCNNIPPNTNQDLWLTHLAYSPITDLDLTGNSINSILGTFSSALKENVTLRHLVLANCDVSSEGLSLLANVLLENNSLISLDLSKNPIGSNLYEGIMSLKTALSRNSSIQSLNLSETQLDSGAVITLAEALPENRSLTRLDLSKNPSIDTAGVLALSVSIKMNHTLTFLDINIPPSDEELANLQNDIVAVCTTNMLQKVEAQKKQEDSSVSSCSSSNISLDLKLPTAEARTKYIFDTSESPLTSPVVTMITSA